MIGQAAELARLAILCAAPVWLAVWLAYVEEQATARPVLDADARAAFALAAGVGQYARVARLYREYRRRWIIGLPEDAPHPSMVYPAQARALVE